MSSEAHGPKVKGRGGSMGRKRCIYKALGLDVEGVDSCIPLAFFRCAFEFPGRPCHSGTRSKPPTMQLSHLWSRQKLIYNMKHLNRVTLVYLLTGATGLSIALAAYLTKNNEIKYIYHYDRNVPKH
ncbi:hypothetical protein TPHA_0N01510 [Tetrapisispora phaffii CBS 4417]|uniref:Uncharacterized protein n=1 Tax=Tetrapisispora phaffii (strain ATCC 24235 / CBS 4417 / NBRC 1672 / NRRL Y-8282 / UCD 70-5) TaxID=1071381 RepID=G8C1A4_TETPH|nr:hypothetical protein TPHA_0N01510 [Tetrapisispora phaffii CBS 4417]CCE65932.1 hypothetical protein TPHA_0N01510 [Tetrapisispora phaffii CBS 4417]